MVGKISGEVCCELWLIEEMHGVEKPKNLRKQHQEHIRTMRDKGVIAYTKIKFLWF
jgi:hypothetical protein